MNTIKVSAPGNMMLLGEHAVLQGHRALVFAVNRRMRVFLTPRDGPAIRIESALGGHETTLDRLDPHPSFRFVLAAIGLRHPHLDSGFDLRIESDFSHTVGLGSSAAVTVAVLAALSAWQKGALDPTSLTNEGIQVIRGVQGLGSGADVAATVHGGVLAYRADPMEALQLAHTHPITVLYSGSKTPTVDVVHRVRTACEKHPALFDGIFGLMDQGVREAATAIREGNWPALGEIMNLSQGLMEAIGVSNSRLSELVYALRTDPAILGSKISGSGLGDCVIGLGQAQRTEWPCEVLPVSITPLGVCLDD